MRSSFQSLAATGPARFPPTAWTLILEASSENGKEALDVLCRRYRPSIFNFIRRSGYSQSEAEDKTQEFFVYLLEREWLKRADPRVGRFRGLICELLRNFLANDRRRENAQKRSAPEPLISFDSSECERQLMQEAYANLDPARAFDRSWFACIVAAAFERLSAEHSIDGRGEMFEALQPLVLQTPERGAYDEIGARIGKTSHQVAKSVYVLRHRLKELIRIEVADTVSDRCDVDAELKNLLDSLSLSTFTHALSHV